MSDWGKIFEAPNPLERFAKAIFSNNQNINDFLKEVFAIENSIVEQLKNNPPTVKQVYDEYEKLTRKKYNDFYESIHFHDDEEAELKIKKFYFSRKNINPINKKINNLPNLNLSFKQLMWQISPELEHIENEILEFKKNIMIERKITINLKGPRNLVYWATGEIDCIEFDNPENYNSISDYCTEVDLEFELDVDIDYEDLGVKK